MHLTWILPLLFVILIAPFTPFLDIAIANLFYEDGQFLENGVVKFIYLVFPWISISFGIVALFAAIILKKSKWKRISLCFLLTLVVGSGLVVNVVLKEFWGRPRPIQIEQFGGPKTYKAFYQPNFGRHIEYPMRSFPSGHASAGFVFLSLILSGWRYKKRALFYSGIILTAFFGSSLSFARIAQGKHFFSDIIFAAFIMWIVALILNRRTNRQFVPFQDLEHTADVAFYIRGNNLQEIHENGQKALAFKCQRFKKYFIKEDPKSLDDIIIALNEVITKVDIEEGSPFKAVSFHGELIEKNGFLEWEMIVDV